MGIWNSLVSMAMSQTPSFCAEMGFATQTRNPIQSSLRNTVPGDSITVGIMCEDTNEIVILQWHTGTRS